MWAVYGLSNVAYGAIKGAVTSSAAGSVQASGTDYFLRGARIYSSTLTGTYTPGSSMSGSYSGGNPGSFTATYDGRYDVAASLDQVAGAWSVVSASTAGNVVTTVRIGTDGAVTASSPLCTLAGSISPAANGKGYFDTSTSFAGAGCPWNGRTLPGVAVRLVVGSQEYLTLAAVSEDGSTGYVASGSR